MRDGITAEVASIGASGMGRSSSAARRSWRRGFGYSKRVLSLKKRWSDGDLYAGGAATGHSWPFMALHTGAILVQWRDLYDTTTAVLRSAHLIER